jgi:hypothetical protein
MERECSLILQLEIWRDRWIDLIKQDAKGELLEE